jgi:hypothetical protein
VAELVDALASGASGLRPLEVQVLSSAPYRKEKMTGIDSRLDGSVRFDEWKTLRESGENVDGVGVNEVDLLSGLAYGQVWISDSNKLVICSGFYVDGEGCCATEVLTDCSTTPAIFYQKDRLIKHGEFALEAYTDEERLEPITFENVLGINIHPYPDMNRGHRPELQEPLSNALLVSRLVVGTLVDYKLRSLGL